MYKSVDLDKGENPDHEGYFKQLLKERDENLYKACIGCGDSWSAGRHTSCHDTCSVFQNWKGGVR